MKLINKDDLNNVAGGIASVISIDHGTGVITYSSCNQMPISITPQHPQYQEYRDRLGDNEHVIL